MKSPTLRTERLLLRAYERSDVPALLPLIGAREVAATTLRIPHPYKEEDAEVLFTPSEENVRLAVTLQAEQRLIGGIGLRLDSPHNRAELGYWIGFPYWGRGYATEAAQAVVRYGFEILNLHRIYAEHFGNNPSSGRVLRKLGMKPEGYLPQHILKWGEYLDVAVYGMLRTDFKAKWGCSPL